MLAFNAGHAVTQVLQRRTSDMKAPKFVTLDNKYDPKSSLKQAG
jgi:hypothetical protein